MNNIKFLVPDTRLTTSEKHIVEYINNNPEKFINQKINEISTDSNVSTSCITRLSKKLNFNTLKEFQINISNNLNFAKQTIGFVEEKNIESSINNLKFFHSYSIKETLDHLNTTELERLIQKIMRCGKILLYGVGSSFLACNEFSNNLEKIGFDTMTSQDFHHILLQIPRLSKNDIVFLISKSGYTKEIQFLIKKAKEFEIEIAFITTRTTNLKNIDYLINFKTYEQENRITAISSKVAQLVLVDLVYTEIFKKQKNKNNEIVNKGTSIIKEWNENL